MIREALTAVSRNEALGGLLSRAPVAKDVVKRLVGGDSIDSVIPVAAMLADEGFWVSVERASGSEPEDPDVLLAEHISLIDALDRAGLAGVAEVTVLAPALGADARSRLEAISARAQAASVLVMLGAAASDDVDRDLALVDGLPVGITLASSLRRTESDCRTLADRRVRLVKGAHRGPDAYAQPIEIDKSYVRCVKVLLRGSADASFATHDPRIVGIAESLALRLNRRKQSYEFAMYMGRQEALQRRLCSDGERVRVYVPYGPEWFARLVGGLAEQSTSLGAAVRSLLPGS